MDYGLWIMDYGLWIMDYGLWIMDYGLWIMDYGLVHTRNTININNFLFFIDIFFTNDIICENFMI